MARTSDPHAAAVKAWESRERAKEGGGSEATTSRDDFAKKTGEVDPDVEAAVMPIVSERTTPTPGKPYHPDVEADADGDGVSDAARVGVPADEVPPPPKVPRLPNLTREERAQESAFADAFEKDPDGMAKAYVEMVKKSATPNKFEVDAAKNLFPGWKGEGIDPERRAEIRSTMNTPLHQTANAIAKRAFLMHLDSLSAEDRAKGLLVTVGGCASGKGFALKKCAEQGISELDGSKYGAVWDSAGDQNATENPWLLAEAKKRGIKVTFAYVSADPEFSWADPKRGAVHRAMNPDDGRMIDADVYADSYVMGARNHAAFSKSHAKDATFIYVENGATIKRINGVPESDTSRSRRTLRLFALRTIAKLGKEVPPRVKRGALAGQRIWHLG